MCQHHQVIFNPAAVGRMAANVQTTAENNDLASSWLKCQLALLPAKTEPCATVKEINSKDFTFTV